MTLSTSSPCPCGRDALYGECCFGKVDWDRILEANRGSEVVRHLSARGKNIAFANEIARTLNLNDEPQAVRWADIKRAVTPKTVKDLHEAVGALWPDRSDLDRVLYDQRAGQAALFIGTYDPKHLLRGLARHALYSDVILVLDPFHHPRSLRDEFNPVVHPDQHRTNTVVALRMWWLLIPWIEAGIVRVIHSPADFDPYLAVSAMDAARERKDQVPDLRAALDKEIEERMNELDEYREYLELCVPDQDVQRRIREADPNVSDEELEAALAYVAERRAQHPFFVEPLNSSGESGDFLSFGVGANYDIAKIIASATGAHLITDQRYRWKEIELDRRAAGIDDHRWSAFAKAFQNANLRFLNTANLDLAVRLRHEERLNDLRLFFRRVWTSVSRDDSFDEALCVGLAAELDDRVKDAEEGWQNINQDLLKWFSSEGIAAGAAVVTGHAALLPAVAAFAAAAAATTGLWAKRRRTFAQRYPASFFVGVE